MKDSSSHFQVVFAGSFLMEGWLPWPTLSSRLTIAIHGEIQGKWLRSRRCHLRDEDHQSHAQIISKIDTDQRPISHEASLPKPWYLGIQNTLKNGRYRFKIRRSHALNSQYFLKESWIEHQKSANLKCEGNS